MTSGGYQVLSQQPDFADQVSIAAARASSLGGFGQARRYAVWPGKDAVHSLAARYVLRGAEIAAMESFHADHCGSWRAFLLPSWVSELANGETNATTTTVGPATLAIDYCDYANTWGKDLDDGKLGRFVFVLYPDGELAVRRVSGVASSAPGDKDVLAVDSGWPQAIVPGDGCLIGFAYLVRFLSDALELEFSGLAQAACDLAFVQALVSVPEADA